MKRLGVSGATICLAILCGSSIAAAAEDRLLSDRVEQALWWLPADTQTVIVAEGPFENDRFVDHREIRTSIRLAAEPDSGPLAGRKIALSVLGSRRFRAPTAKGAWRYEGAQIVVYEKPLGEAWELTRTLLLASVEIGSDTVAIEVERIRGLEVVATRMKHGDEVWSELVAHPAPNVIVRATDRSYLEEVLTRMEKRAAKRALPPELPEWKLLPRATPVWAIRHFDRHDVDDDPSSPLAKEPGIGERDDQALGLVFSFNPAKDRTATVHYLSGHAESLRLMKGLWHQPDHSLEPEIRPGVPGVVEIRMPIEGSARQRTTTRMFFLMLGAVLGHGAD